MRFRRIQACVSENVILRFQEFKIVLRELKFSSKKHSFASKPLYTAIYMHTCNNHVHALRAYSPSADGLSNKEDKNKGNFFIATVISNKKKICFSTGGYLPYKKKFASFVDFSEPNVRKLKIIFVSF